MMAKKNTVTIRVPLKFKEILEEKGTIREGKGLSKFPKGKTPKMTELLMKTRGFNLALGELEFKPERRRRR